VRALVLSFTGDKVTSAANRAKLYKAFDKRMSGVEKVFVETKFSSPPMKGTPELKRVDDWGK
jgi:hypothetical protein